MSTVQDLISTLSNFWGEHGCALHLGHDVETGAGTFNPATFFRCLGPEPYRAAYVELSRRPKDGRYGQNPNRLQLFHQYQVIIKPSPHNIQEIYLKSLEALGFELKQHDIRFVHDDWEQPTLGAWGLGWEVWRDGMEVTQFTYFQAVGGVDLDPITVELTYGIERLAMTLQNVDNVYDLHWSEDVSYRDIYHQNEVQWSRYNFEEANVDMWRSHFERYDAEAKRLLERKLPLPAYDFVMKASHAFNLLDARGVVSVTERTGFIERIRDLARGAANGYIAMREELGFPLARPDHAVHVPELPSPKIDQLDGEADFVLEIGSEELPATFVPIGCRNLESRLTKLLETEKIPFKHLRVMGTPRRLTAYIQGLARARPPELQERKGPAVEAAFDSQGALTKAGEGFFRSANLTPVSLDAIRAGKESAVEVRTLKGTEYLFAKLQRPAQPTAELLAKQLPDLILGIDFPKKMRWNCGNIAFARPLHWIVALHGEDVIPFAIGDIVSGRISSGHRQVCKGTFPIPSADQYVAMLRNHKVIVDIEERREAILNQLQAIEKQSNTQALELDHLVPEVVHLVEWPQLTQASFDEHFLQVPAEVLISEMVHHQRYFPLADTNGTLTTQFVITADNDPSDKIRQGNVKVVSARLADGVFLYQQDIKCTLDDFNEKLKQVTFRKELGSVYDKAQRIVANSEELQKEFPLVDLAMVKRAASLCKADLASELVDEFPDLQGIIGCHYALQHGENPDVAQAIDEHWMPRGEKGPLPKTPTGRVVSIADKLDNLLSCFALGLKPTSSSDPYGLRRQVLGIVKILIDGAHRVCFTPLLERCYDRFLDATGLPRDDTVIPELIAFFRNRIKTVFLDYGLTKEETEASLSTGFSDIYDSYCRVQALHKFRVNDPRFALLAEVFKRAKGQIEGQELGAFDAKALVEPQEIALFEALNATEKEFTNALHSYAYDRAYQLLAELQPTLADLFDNVLVLAEDPQQRTNRLTLLTRLFGLFNQLLDFSKIRLTATTPANSL